MNVVLNQLKDLQLAIAITRVYEGEDGPVLKELLEDKVLPLAAQEGNRWLASWAFWMLHRRDMSVIALVVSTSILFMELSANMYQVAGIHTSRNTRETRDGCQIFLD